MWTSGESRPALSRSAELSADPNAKPEDLGKDRRRNGSADHAHQRPGRHHHALEEASRRHQGLGRQSQRLRRTEEILTGVVTEVIKGGVIAVYERRARVYPGVPGDRFPRRSSWRTCLKRKLQFRIIEVNRSRRRAVGSIRSRPQGRAERQLADKFWETAEDGKDYTGVVKSLTAYGAFVDLGGIDGMIHISELSWSRIKHPSEGCQRRRHRTGIHQGP